MMTKGMQIKLFSVALAILVSCFQYGHAQNNKAKLVVKFETMANNKPLVLGDSGYVNEFAESYTITRLKYYISNISLGQKINSPASTEVFLVDAAHEDSISIWAWPGLYTKMIFTLGIDSALNNSGAQDGALDPLNGMFWTWNSGYVYFKMEGFSNASTADLQRIEHHIGGYQGPNKAVRQIELNLQQPLIINEGDQKEMTVVLNLDKYWKGQNDISIASKALIMIPGEWAKKSADNFPGMFTVKIVK